MSLKGKPSPPPVFMLKNVATAPLIYFDSAPVHGICNGSVSIELATQAILPKSDGGVITDMMCTAHLRCTPFAAKILIDALTNALNMMEAQAELQREQSRESVTDNPLPN